MNSRVGVAPANQDFGYRSQGRPEVMNLLPTLKENLKVLEIGCGEGKFCLDLPGSVEAWGVEPDSLSAEVAAARLHKVFPNTFDEIEDQLPASYFDLVVCNDVIEHMTDHDSFLHRIQHHMAPGSYLVGSLPNVRFYGNLFNLIVARDWHYQDSGILDRTHFRFFSCKSLRRSLEEAGFGVHRLEGLNEARQLDWSIRTLAERLFRTVLIVLSLGAGRDVKYMRIGFLAAANRC